MRKNQEKNIVMYTHQTNLRLRCLSPLQFNLVVPKEDVYDTVLKLKAKAQSLFPKVSKVFRLFDDGCLPIGFDDPLLDVKILGQGMFIINNKILTVSPKSIVGFAFLLPTNKVAYLALASYPSTTKDLGKTITVPFNGNAVWSGIIETFLKKCNSCKSDCDECILSHELSCELLQETENMGILEEVKDPTDFWATRSTQSFVDTSNRLRCGCLSENA